MKKDPQPALRASAEATSSPVLRELVILWGRSHNPMREKGRFPTTTHKGVRELELRGHKTINLYPGQSRDRVLPLFGPRLATLISYILAAVHLMFLTRKHHRIIYTSDLAWIRIIAKLKSLRLVRNRLVVKWGGIDFGVAEITQLSNRQRRAYKVIAEAMNVCWIASEKCRQQWIQLAPEAEQRMAFWPTAVDVEFYSDRKNPAEIEARNAIVAVGTDRKRDWQLPLELARRGVPIILLTDDRRVVDLVKKDPTTTARLVFGVGFDRSAEILADCRGIILSTHENYRFSGSTTVGVAAALGKPLILDEQFDLASYGLEDGVNCLYFERGNIEAAYGAARAILGDNDLSQTLGWNLSQLAQYYAIERFADALEGSFRAEWHASEVLWPPETIPAVARCGG